jgi:ABC-type Fe3+ transport system substrate-binding protein
MVNRRVMNTRTFQTSRALTARRKSLLSGLSTTTVGCIAFTGIVAALALSGCGNRGASTAGGNAPVDAKTLTIVSPHGGEIRAEFERLWKQKHPDTTLKWIDKGGTADDLRYVQAQFATKPNGIGHDIFFGGGAETFVELETSGVLQPLPSHYNVPADLNGTPLRGPKNEWVAAALSGFGILYNKKIVQEENLPLPKSWGDLGNPRLRDQIELADPRHSGSAHAAYEIILQANGWDQGWKTLCTLTANARRFTRAASDLPQDVASGEVAMAPAIDFYARARIARAGEEKLGYVAPSGQNVITPDPIGILKGAPNLELAREWVSFVMSPEAQKLWMLKKGAQGGPKQNDLFRQAALPSLYKPIAAESLIQTNPYTIKNARPYDAAKAAKRRRALDELIGTVLIDNHDMIRAKWAKNPDAKAIGFVPVSEAELMRIAEKWDDAAFRTQTLSAWNQAAQKYFE